MIAEFGLAALWMAAALACLQLLLCGLALTGRQGDLFGPVKGTAIGQAILVMLSFGALVLLFSRVDLSVALVAANNHSAKPMLYRIAGTWGNHEGSMLLWITIMSLSGGAIALFERRLKPLTLMATLGAQAVISLGFFAFLLLSSNPFARLNPAPAEGQGLNPLLQDPGLAFHPPFLYLGYVGLSITYSFAIAALLEGRVDAAWGRWVRPWTLAAWVSLTIGIGLGSWWAYYELGWGGFWFWDPVENASFMPWLISAALLHSAIVVEKREALKAWTVLLAIIAFGFSLIGTFIVRSGVITSVHAFANDPERGIYILALFAFFVGGALMLYAARAGIMEAKGVFSSVSRESALVLNNVLLAVASFVVFIGTIWPLISELVWGRTVSVGPPFFNAAFTPFVVALAVILPFGAILPWKRAKADRAFVSLRVVLFLSVAAGALAFALQSGRSALGPVGLALGLWVILGAVADLWQRSGRGNLLSRLDRMRRLPRADWGKAVSHGGLGVTILSVAAMLSWQVEDIRVAQINEPFDVGGYQITLKQVTEEQGPNYRSTMGWLEVVDGNRRFALNPERRFYPAAGMPTTEAGIDYGFMRDVYLVLGDPQANGAWTVRSYVKPLANWLWAGILLMSFGGLISLTDRRYRVAAGAGREAAKPVAAE